MPNLFSQSSVVSSRRAADVVAAPVTVKSEDIDDIRLLPVNNLKNPWIPPFVCRFHQLFRSDEQERRKWKQLRRNVFQPEDEMSAFEALKLFLGLFIAVPRIMLLLLIFIVHSCVMLLTMKGHDPKQPLPPSVINLQAAINLFTLYLCTIILDVVVSIKGTPCEFEENLVQVTCPYSSWLEILVINFSNPANFHYSLRNQML